MVLYYLAGQLINTDVRHRWDCLTPEARYLTVCWLGPGQWVLEVEDTAPGDGQQAPFTAYRQVGLDDDFLFSPTYVTPLTTVDALALLARYEHGPDIWTCACDFCVCECGVSWHIHPRWERPLPVPRPASCPVLAGRPLLPPHYPPHNGACRPPCPQNPFQSVVEHLSNPCLFFVQKVSPIDGTSGVRLPPIANHLIIDM